MCSHTQGVGMQVGVPVLGAGGIKDRPCGEQTVALRDEEGGRYRQKALGREPRPHGVSVFPGVEAG